MSNFLNITFKIFFDRNSKNNKDKKLYYSYLFIYLGLRINGHSKHRSGHGYETASILSSDLETTTFLESDDDASSRITSTTGRHTNMSSTVDRATLGKYILKKKKINLRFKLENEFYVFKY